MGSSKSFVKSPSQQVYSFAEMAAIDCAAAVLQDVYCTVFTAETLLEELTLWSPHLGDPHLDAALTKLRQEPPGTLAEWLAGRRTWTSLAEENQFAMLPKKDPADTKTDLAISHEFSAERRRRRESDR